MADEPRRISEITYAIPFGRYVGAKKVARGADEVLVGREGQRNYFIELLISSGRQGAYLVTGRRGAGKTSFVKHCIKEYQESVFRRFLRGTVGRGFLDRLLLVLFWAALFGGGLLASEAAQLLVPLATDPTGHLPLLWIALAPIFLLLLYPCLYARAAFEAIADSLTRPEDSRHNTRFSSVLATVLTPIIAISAWFLPPFGDASLALGLVFAWLSSVYLCVQALSYEVRRSATATKRFRSRAAVLSTVLLFATLLVLSTREMSSWKTAVLLGGVFLGLGAALRGVYQHRLSHAVGPAQRDFLRPATRRGGKNYFWLPLLCVATCGGTLLRDRAIDLVPLNWSGITLLSGVLLASAAATFLFFRRRKEKGTLLWVFLPRPRFVLAIGAGISIVVSLHLLQPILAPTSGALLDLLGVRSLMNPIAQPSERVLGTTSLAELVDFSLPENWRHRLPYNGPGLRGASAFENRTDRLAWVLLATILFMALHFIEYEWVVRPYVRIREETSVKGLRAPPWEDLDGVGEEHERSGEEPNRVERESWRHHRSFARLSLPWAVYRAWLPVVPVSVNLGFDVQLSASQIIQAMLVGLRDRYFRTFLSWSSTVANMGRFLSLLCLLMLVSLAGDAWFSLPDRLQIDHWKKQRPNGTPVSRLDDVSSLEICRDLEQTRSGRPLVSADLPCWAGDLWFMGLHYDLVPDSINLVSRSQEVHGEPLLFSLFPFSQDSEHTLSKGLNFCVFHILLLLGFITAGRFVLRKLPLLPYQGNLRQIDDLLDNMTARTRLTSSPTIWEPARWIHSLLTEKTRETEREPLDSRTVELAFLQILDDLQTGGVHLPGMAQRHLSLPAPEITFVFDELDKLGTRIDPEDETLRPVAQEFDLLKSERQRALKLRALLSDLKNVLSAAPARFIFIGGRNLYDEWLADQTARQPLLTNIFNAIVYLPSLISDHAAHGVPAQGHLPERLDSRIEEYLVLQYRRAENLYAEFLRKRWRPTFGFPMTSPTDERFSAYPPGDRVASLLRVLDCRGGKPLEADGKALLLDFLSFLTHRSAGNPKRLRDLVESFVRPTSRVVQSEARWTDFACQHMLRFRDDEVFRVQLIATLFRHLASTFEARIANRDDKMATSILFLTDFLLKFHRRAFSWSNLERVDELAHIHRAPDLRDVQEEIVDLFSERFLHRVLNGMYSFRFRSDIAREIEYLSRRSASEMAALNFTLDESQSLKALYLAAMDPERERNAGQLAALGELYEFDQEYETARRYYLQAIELLDQEVTMKTGDPTMIAAILRGDIKGRAQARIFFPWAESRLRLMLQIGLTFEVARNLERAEVEYRSARSLARSVTRTCLGDREAWPATLLDDSLSRGRLHTAKHLSILFQPLFAEAWVAEKITATIDTSVSLLERSLDEMRGRFPFVEQRIARQAEDPVKSAHANFSLTFSQLHNKTGDLYFFKGRQQPRRSDLLSRTAPDLDVSATELLPLSDLERHTFGMFGVPLPPRPGSEQADRPTEGYLLRSHYHYALGLHDLRRYLWFRVASSKVRLSIAPENLARETLHRESLPDFPWRSAATAINDMAEATLARVSLVLVLSEACPPKDAPFGGVQSLEDLFLKWLSSPDDDGGSWRYYVVDAAGQTLVTTSIANWFGSWTPEGRGRNRLTFRSGGESSYVRLAVSLHFCHLGACLFERGGYPEDAARELLQVCETVSRYLWWIAGFRMLRNISTSGAGANVRRISDWDALLADMPKSGVLPKNLAYWRTLVDLAIKCLGEASRLFQQSRFPIAARANWSGVHDSDTRAPCGTGEGGAAYLVGDVIPPDAVTLASSLGLWLGLGLLDSGAGAVKNSLRDLLCAWGVVSGACHVDYETLLQESLTRHRFPLLNRLQGLKVLVDAKLLQDAFPAKEDLANALCRIEEILEAEAQFAAPFHFTPLQSGVTCSLFWLRWTVEQRDVGPLHREIRERLFRFAERNLRLSEEMCTQRRAFYENISDLYYLYDDFNDRQIHYQHAIQMAAADLTAVLRHVIREAEGRFGVDGTGGPPTPACTRERPASTVQPGRAGGGWRWG